MRLEVFGKEIKDWNEDEAQCFKDAVLDMDISVKEWTEVYISKNEVTIALEGRDFSPVPSNSYEDMAFFFNIKEQYFDNGGGLENPPEDIDWACVEAFYVKYADIQDGFIDAIDNGDFETMKRLHEQFPNEAKPSLSDSFYARWMVKQGRVDILEWAKSVDPDIDFSPKNRHENPLKIAIGYNSEEVALWLLDNYPEINIFDKYNPLELLKKARDYEMARLEAKLLDYPEMIDKIVEEGATKYLPKSVKDVFLF